MYGFGDEENPYQESVELLEDLVIHFVQDMVSFCVYFASKFSFELICICSKL